MGVSVGHDKTLRNAVRLFNEFLADPVEGKHFASDLKDIVYSAGVATAGRRAWTALWDRYLLRDTKSGEKHRIILVLSQSTDKTIIEELVVDGGYANGRGLYGCI